MATDTPKKIKIGICMAGAVSAGAYTAGVIDYLIETLEFWEKAKEKNRAIGEGKPGYDERIPMHDVEIGVLSGASAGGMTAIIASRAIQETIEHASFEQFRQQKDQYKPKNPLYNAWVSITEQAQSPMMLQILQNDDISRPGSKVVSFLNSNFIDTLASAQIKPYQGNKCERPYFNDNLEVMVSLTNLNGIEKGYNFVSSSANQSPLFTARQHLDFGHFVVRDLSEGKTQRLAEMDSETRKKLRDIDEEAVKGRIPVYFAQNQNQNIDVIRDAGMATGAFPIGLAYRKLKRNSKYLIENKALRNIVKVDFSLGLGTREEYEAVIVDGGMLNNEPFEVTKFVLEEQIKRAEKIGDPHNQYHEEPIILMIDPFPSEEIKDKMPETPDLYDMAMWVFRTMRSQLLFKPEQLSKALALKDSTRFIIAPGRKVMDDKNVITNIEGAHAIACGSLGGFGGFLDRSFREHDYFLGRKNCQSFLQKYFRVSDNSTEKFDLLNTYSAAAQKAFAFRSPDGALNVPIIPDMRLLVIDKHNQSILEASKGEDKPADKLPQNPEALAWDNFFDSLRVSTPPEYDQSLLPQYDLNSIKTWQNRLLKRIYLVLYKILNLGWFGRLFLWLAVFVFFKGRIVRTLRRYIQTDLDARGMLRS